MGNLTRKKWNRINAVLTAAIFIVGILFLIRYYSKDDIKHINAYVTAVIDGDTIVADIDGKERKVRLIGIDTPESVSEIPEKNTEEGRIASEYTEERLLNKVVTIETDVQETDRYGRLLAYVYTEGRMFNTELLELGYARVLTVPPNIRYEKTFQDAQARAIADKKGFWK